MTKYLILFIFCTSIAYAGWTGDWYKNVKRTQSNVYSTAANHSIIQACTKKVNEYKLLSSKNKNSKYFAWKLETWLKRCNKENGITK